ncbi:electron transfer flavoprotein subunit beta/FixA family protein [Corynebacterium epidermidicanis]|uniref:Electron transfer flavoprotein subunit beta n=1 Tax=Corynebacterium epidermidicanis TaxID=1050174 RepID=A0A0G3GQ37_9CORY|nr:electron transfer flavoprotein subunit beta/FixA family protein [Corynebacterium epidermidicanis]AKK02665.1 electron transfer flavoprotein beta subunit [Corynebacterium epidermidicanis]
MRIAVLVKEVPDTYGERRLNLETGLRERGEEQVLDEICERAIEAALQIPGENTVDLVTMSPEAAGQAIRKGLAMGADKAISVTDDKLLGADLTLTAETLAKALEKENYDLILAGNLSTDGNAGILPAMIAEHLDLPLLAELNELAVAETQVEGTRAVEGSVEKLQAQLPALVTITEAFADPRYPNFKGIMAAKKKPFDVLTLADLQVDAEDFTHPRAIMTEVGEKPPRQAGTKITDDGSAAAQLADYLAQNKLI